MNLYILNLLNNLNLKWNLRRIVRKEKEMYLRKISSIESAENEISDEVDEDELDRLIRGEEDDSNVSGDEDLSDEDDHASDTDEDD